jgi:hypothetical protein
MPPSGRIPSPFKASKTFIPITVDLKALNFTKWCNFNTIVITQFALADHLDAVLPQTTGSG